MEKENIVIKTEPFDDLTDSLEQEPSPFSYLEFITPDNENDSNSNTIDIQSIKTEVEDSSSESTQESLNTYFFESDHPALKVNADYQNLIQAIAILEAQRTKAIKDLDKLYELQEEALTNPIDFVERLQKKEDLNIPGPQLIHPVPEIDWSKYSFSSSVSAFGRRQLTRLSAKVSQDTPKNAIKGKGSCLNDQQKTLKANQYWSIEEQMRLEELLVQFPPEEVETRRWEKIANCLENRTPIQVASRIQKYFIKLMKAGIPIPGRTPSTVYLKKPRRNIIRQQPSTFLVSHSLPVYMPDVEEDYSQKSFCTPKFSDISKEIKMEFMEDEDISNDLADTSEFQELKMLKNILRDKLKTCGLSEHVGFKCVRCNADPIIGVRWHCTVCKSPFPVDFCDDCMESKFSIGSHTMDHVLEEIPNAISDFSTCGNDDYTEEEFSYLDQRHMSTA